MMMMANAGGGGGRLTIGVIPGTAGRPVQLEEMPLEPLLEMQERQHAGQVEQQEQAEVELGEEPEPRAVRPGGSAAQQGQRLYQTLGQAEQPRLDFFHVFSLFFWVGLSFTWKMLPFYYALGEKLPAGLDL